MSIFKILVYTISLIFISSNIFGQTRMEPKISQEISISGTAPVIIVFEQFKIKQQIPVHLSKKDKGAIAFDLLKSHFENVSGEAIAVLKKRGAVNRINYLSTSVYVPYCDAATLASLTSCKDVKVLMYNYQFGKFSEEFQKDELTERNTYTWGVTKTEADLLHEQGIKGAGAVIGGSDTGFDWTHPAIQEMYRGYSNTNSDHNYNWHDAIHQVSPLSNPDKPNPCGLSIKYPCDDHSHGTHTMGTMVGIQGDTLTIGMAPEAKWIATRNMERGNGSLQSYLEALDWFLAPTDTNDLNPDPSKAPDVINNSWYCSVDEGCNVDNWSLMRTSVSNLKAAGIVVVASAGNFGPGCETISFVPGLIDEAFSVGATDSEDTIAGFSSRGLVAADGSFRLKPDVSAPGVNVYSSVLNHNYSSYSGTSMAGPHVAGLVALMISANPDIAGQVDTIQEIIKNTAVPLKSNQDCSGIDGETIPNPVYGYGRINALAAVNEAKKFVLLKNKGQVTTDSNIYPNPTKGNITITNLGRKPITSIQINNLTGKLVKVIQIKNPQFKFDIDAQDLGAGIYFVKIYRGVDFDLLKMVKI